MAEIAAAGAKVKHPPGLYLISFTSIWERFSYYGNLSFQYCLYLNSCLNGCSKTCTARINPRIIRSLHRADMINDN